MFNFSHLLADINPIELVAVMIPITIFMIPIIAILTHHQRKMAELMRQQHPQSNPNEIAELRREVYELKQLVSQQAIQMDDFLGNQKKLLAGPTGTPQDLQSRVGS